MDATTGRGMARSDQRKAREAERGGYPICTIHGQQEWTADVRSAPPCPECQRPMDHWFRPVVQA